ncbi:hypothetical protein ACJMK2_022330 [Sinanodonta woodiana]|uniref:BRCT domain-containing protein n=1 Tax=Sinanodonta woodiana TaxID=1069815 RepID=A0ABD3TIQ6_SINWO
MSGRKKLSRDQQRKRKIKATEQARKSSKWIAAYLKVDEFNQEDSKPIASESSTATVEEENDKMELSIVSENSDSESIATNEDSLDMEKPPCEEDQAYPKSIHKTHSIFVFNDIGFLTFTAAGRPCLDDNIKDTLVKIGAGTFRNEDIIPKTKRGTKFIARGMTESWFEKSLPNGQQVPHT